MIAKSFICHIDTGDTPLLRANLYQKSQLKHATVSKELKQLLDTGMLASRPLIFLYLRKRIDGATF